MPPGGRGGEGRARARVCVWGVPSLECHPVSLRLNGLMPIWLLLLLLRYDDAYPGAQFSAMALLHRFAALRVAPAQVRSVGAVQVHYAHR